MFYNSPSSNIFQKMKRKGRTISEKNNGWFWEDFISFCNLYASRGEGKRKEGKQNKRKEKEKEKTFVNIFALSDVSRISMTSKDVWFSTFVNAFAENLIFNKDPT